VVDNEASNAAPLPIDHSNRNLPLSHSQINKKATPRSFFRA
jgi:hypothetical protein